METFDNIDNDCIAFQKYWFTIYILSVIHNNYNNYKYISTTHTNLSRDIISCHNNYLGLHPVYHSNSCKSFNQIFIQNNISLDSR